MGKTIKSNNFHPKVVDLLRLSKTPDHLKPSDNKPYSLIFTWITILIKKLFLNQVLRQVHFRLNSNYTNSTGFNATFPIKLTRYHPWLANVLVVPLFPFFEFQGPRNSRLNNCYEFHWRRPCSVMQRQEKGGGTTEGAGSHSNPRYRDYFGQHIQNHKWIRHV